MEQVYYEVKTHTHARERERERETDIGDVIRGSERGDVVKYREKSETDTDSSTRRVRDIPTENGDNYHECNLAGAIIGNVDGRKRA
jgi:hypothetical protein